MAIRQAGEVGTRLPSSMASDLLDSLPVAVGCVDAEECVVFVNRAFSAAVAVAAGAQLRGAPDPLGRLGACAREVITTGAPAELTVAGTAGWARVFPVGAEHAGVVLAGPVSAAARSAEEQAALRRVAMLVAKDAAPEAVFAAASEQVGRLLGAEVGAVLRFIGAERAVVAGVWREDGIRGFPVNAELDFDRTNSAIGRALATRCPARADTYEDARGQLPRVLKAVGVRSSVAAPVMLDDEVWGAVTVSTTRDEPLPEGGEMKLVAFAELVGQTLADAEARAGSPRRGCASSRRPTRRAGGSSPTCTRARSSTWSPSCSSSRSRRPARPRARRSPSCSRRRSRRPTRSTRRCTSSRAGCTRRSSRSAASPPRCRGSSRARRSPSRSAPFRHGAMPTRSRGRRTSSSTRGSTTPRRTPMRRRSSSTSTTWATGSSSEWPTTASAARRRGRAAACGR
jgi:hypothetical protein